MNICGKAEAPVAPLAAILEAMQTCCIGVVELGPGDCTCWEPIYDKTQQEPNTSAPFIVERIAMCDDCAFRPDSPERQGDERYSHSDADELRRLPHFWCHQGMRKVVGWKHPAGMTIDNDTDAYAPPLRSLNGESVPFRADGSPADRCGGFAAWKRAEAARA